MSRIERRDSAPPFDPAHANETHSRSQELHANETHLHEHLAHEAIDRRTALDAFEVGALMGRVSFDEVTVPESAALTGAQALVKEGKIDEALRALATVVREPNNANAGAAAVMAGKLALEKDRSAAAEHFTLLAEKFAPQHEGTLRLRLASLVAEKATADILSLSQKLLDQFPKDTSLMRIRASAFLDDAQPDAAVEVAERAWRQVKNATPIDVKEAARTGGAYGFALTKANRSDDAVRVLEECLALAPEDASLHSRISEYVQPDFKNKAKRKEIKQRFDAANAAWQSGDDAKVKSLAREILKIDPRDGLAHHLYSSAHERSRLKKLGLLQQIDEPKEQRALIEKLTEVCARAKIKDRAGKIEDLFPEWPQLTVEQRATIAYSVLGFAGVIPAIMEKGTEFHFALPGTSLCEIDPQADIEKKKAFGRMSYSGRGWAYHRLNRVYVGLERVDGSARGERNTVTHEFAHLVHYYLRDLAETKKTRALTPRETALADIFDRVEKQFQEARDRKDGQMLLDAYSGTNVWEYFAQGVMGYLAMTDRLKESAPRLYSRNPKLWRTAAFLAQELAEFPKTVDAPNPAPIGAGQSGTLRQLHALAETAKSRHVAAQAKSVLLRLEKLFERDERPFEQKKEEEGLLLGRGRELILLDRGEAAAAQIADAGRVLPLLDLSAVKALTLLLLQDSARTGVRPPPLVEAYRLASHDDLRGARAQLLAHLS